MSQSVLNAIQRAREKRERKLAAFWQRKEANPAEWAKIKENRIRFESEFSNGIPMDFPIVLDCEN